MNFLETISIGLLAQQTGLATSAIRYYERLGLLPVAHRQNGQRRYDRSVVNTLHIIQMAQQLGFSLEEVRHLLYAFPQGTEPSARWQQMSQIKLQEIDLQIEALQQVRQHLQQTLNCQCNSLEQCGSNNPSNTVERFCQPSMHNG